MEMSSANFFTAPRAPGQKVSVTSDVDSAGHRVTGAAGVTDVFHAHWTKVFTRGTDAAPNRAQRRRLVWLLHRRLSDAQRAALAEPLSDDEFVSAIRTLRHNAPPGLDGLPAEFFQLDPELFGRLFRLVFDAQRDRGQLLGRHRESAVIFLF